VIVDYIATYKDRFGVEPIVEVLNEHGITIALSTYYEHAAREFGPTTAELEDAYAANEVHRLWTTNRRLYGQHKLWKTACRAGGVTGRERGRDQVARLMRIAGIRGVVRGKRSTITTRPEPAAPRHPDHIQRAWDTPARPDQWWVADFSYVWTLAGFIYVSFVTDVYSRRILGWRVTTSKTTPLVLSALEQAIFTRRRGSADHGFEFTTTGLVHHSDAGSQHVAGVHRGTPRGWDHRLDRHSRGRAGQRADGVDHRPVQDRGHRAREAHRTVLERPRGGREGHRFVGPLVQHRPAPYLHRRRPTHRTRGALPPHQQLNTWLQ